MHRQNIFSTVKGHLWCGSCFRRDLLHRCPDVLMSCYAKDGQQSNISNINIFAVVFLSVKRISVCCHQQPCLLSLLFWHFLLAQIFPNHGKCVCVCVCVCVCRSRSECVSLCLCILANLNKHFAPDFVWFYYGQAQRANKICACASDGRRTPTVWWLFVFT